MSTLTATKKSSALHASHINNKSHPHSFPQVLRLHPRKTVQMVLGLASNTIRFLAVKKSRFYSIASELVAAAKAVNTSLIVP